MHHRLRAGALLLAAAGAFALIAAGPVSAQAATSGARTTSHSAAVRPDVSCSGRGCDHTDPFATGCAGPGASYGVVATIPVRDGAGSPGGYVQLWYSSTCGTNWARVVPQTSCYEVQEQVVTADGRSDLFTFPACEPSWSNQLYAPTVQASAKGSVFTDSGNYFGQTPWV